MKNPILYVLAGIAPVAVFVAVALRAASVKKTSVTTASVMPIATPERVAAEDDIIVQRDRRWDLCIAAHGIPTMTFSNKINGGLLCLDPRAVIPLEGSKP